MIVTVTRDGMPPIADAGPDRTVNEGDVIELDEDGIHGYPDGNIVSYQWKQVHGPVAGISDETSAKASFIAQAVRVDQLPLTFDLTVVDNGGTEFFGPGDHHHCQCGANCPWRMPGRTRASSRA